MGRAVNRVSQVINKKSDIPALTYILFELDETCKCATLTGSDSGIWISDVICIEDVEVLQPESSRLLIPAELLRQALSELQSQDLEIEVSGYECECLTFSIHHETGCTTIPVRDDDGYPQFIVADNMNNEFEMDTKMVVRVLRRSLFAVSDNDLRPAMAGVFFDFMGDNTLQVVATDGRVLIKNKEVVPECSDKCSIILPRKVARILPGLLTDEDETYMSFNDKNGIIECGTMRLAFLKMEANYPNYNSVIPDNLNYAIKASRLALITAIKNVDYFTADNRLIMMHISKDTLSLRGEDINYQVSATDSIDIEPEGEMEPMKIGMKGNLLADSLSHIDSGRVIIRYISPERAITIEPCESRVANEEVMILQMPMMINDN